MSVSVHHNFSLFCTHCVSVVSGACVCISVVPGDFNFNIYYVVAGNYPRNSSVKYRGDSGLQDGNSAKTNLIGGYYDSGNNIKFTFTTAYTMTLLSWSAMEYQTKFADIDELDHVRDIIRWGTDYLLKVFITSTGSNLKLYSQARYKFCIMFIPYSESYTNSHLDSIYLSLFTDIKTPRIIY